MQAHSLSFTAARIASLPSPTTPTPGPIRPASNPALPPSLLLPAHGVRKSGFAVSPHAPFPHSETATPIAQRAGLAHDAGNLLGALRLYCDLLSAPGVLRPEHLHYADELSLIASRSTALMEHLRQTLAVPATFAAQPNDGIESGTVAAATGLNGSHLPARGSSPALVLRTLAPVLERIAAGAARVIVTTPTAMPCTDLAAEALERIAVNLVRNAAEAIRCSRANIPTGEAMPGQIRVALEIFAGSLRLTVEDNGPGLPPAVAAAFLRPAPLPAGLSRGLGHRIVHELAESTGGQLSIRVRPGRGTTFCIRWRMPETAATPAANVRATKARSLPGMHAEGVTVC